MIENIVTLLIISLIVSTAREDRAIGDLIVIYYLVYMAIELSEFSFSIGNVYISYENSSHWYLFCCLYSLSFFMVTCYLLIKGKGIIVLYALWLLFDSACCGLMAISQTFETNVLLNVYNNLQDFSLLVDLLVVFIGTDHFVKRNFCAASRAINYINNTIDHWCYLDFKTSDKG